MGCANCGTGGSAGCQNNGHCSTGGCNKLNVFDWLSNMDVPSLHRFDIVEVRFKNGRKEFFRNAKKLDIVTGDPVVVDVPNGHHIGYVSLQGELVRLQLSKKGIDDDESVREIYRKATSRDMERWNEARNREEAVMYRTKEIIQQTKLEMKLTDVEFQADGTKATFFYSADGRVDFRELIKMLAGEFRIRVEMRQISVRQEAGRIGGLGVCGRELCCSTWLTDFKNVSTSAARYQNLSLNPSKLSGQCGRLKCCLNYELDTYMEALRDIPEVEKPLQTQRGNAKLQKTDIFRKIMWFGYDDDNNWQAVDAARVKEIQEMNKKGKKPSSLTENEIEPDQLETSSINSDLEAMDRKFSGKGNKNKKKHNKHRGKKPHHKKSENS
ncbi:regulatory iron-sulfur-containing complex subunit RicT [Ekhidna sp.]|uniref:PSP1 domain-containing protein n=1 Tax=Ekhidna sp. TaxID=2608089 RepID=UPI00329760C3